jgi:hypothetical protein
MTARFSAMQTVKPVFAQLTLSDRFSLIIQLA